MRTRSVGNVVLLACCGWLLLACRPEPPRTSLHQAVLRDDLRLVQQHIEARSDLNAKDTNGWTALHLASLRGNLPIVKALVAGGADTQAAGLNGKSPLDLARDRGQVAIAKFFLDLPAKGQRPTGRGLVDGGLGVSGAMETP
ncbi:MAG: ankyrin repeat domain-containing protein [Verrucomicrobiales bacterium]|nr:ankyrin repeat domain-containing protein [Verrucomicrobiales bacterium]